MPGVINFLTFVGAVAVLISSYEVVGATPYYWNGQNNDDIVIPAFELDYYETYDILDTLDPSVPVYASVTPGPR